MSFLEQFKGDDEPERPVGPVTPNAACDHDHTAYALKALQAECATLAAMHPRTGRNAKLNDVATRAARFAVAGWIDPHTAEAMCAEAGRATHGAAATFRSGWAYGLKEGAAPCPGPPQPVVRALPTLNVPSRPWKQVETVPGVDEYSEGDEPDLDLPEALDWDELWTREDHHEWILEPFLAPGRLTALYSAPKMGKSLLVLELAVAVSNGTPALGAPTNKTRVLYLDFENDPTADIRARLIDMGYTPDDLRELDYLSFPRIPPLDTMAGALYLEKIIEKYSPGLVIIDTISRAVSGDENDNDTWLNLYRYTGVTLKRAGVAMLRLDHEGKDAAKGQRGGSAKVGDVDAVWRLSEVVKGHSYKLDCEAQRMHITETELTLIRGDDPLRHTVTTDRPWVLQKAAILEALDKAGLPKDAGRDRARTALTAAGIKVRNATLARLLKERQGGITAWLPQDE